MAKPKKCRSCGRPKTVMPSDPLRRWVHAEGSGRGCPAIEARIDREIYPWRLRDTKP